MGIVQGLCDLALRQLMGESAEAVMKFVRGQAGSGNRRFLEALRTSNRRAWDSLEIALAGQSWWGRLKDTFLRPDEQAFARDVRAFLESRPLPQLEGQPAYQRNCLSELRNARKQGLLGDRPDELDQLMKKWVHHGDPQTRLTVEIAVLQGVIGELEGKGYQWLGWLLKLAPQGGMPLVVVAARFFFRRELETDAELFRGLTFQQLDGLQAAQAAGFQGLQSALKQHADLFQRVSDELRGTLDRVEAGQNQLSQQVEQLRKDIGDLIQRHPPLAGKVVVPAFGVTIQSDQEQALVRKLLERVRSLPSDEQNNPELSSLVGRVQYGAGDFNQALDVFKNTAASAATPETQAEAHFNAYRAALKSGQYDEALAQLQQALTRQAARYTPFPCDKYRPVKILGAGGFGVTFLCEHAIANCKVAVKSLTTEHVSGNVGKLFEEANVLSRVRHPGIIQFQDCDYADREKTRPFVVMEYFEGDTLEHHVKINGPLPQDQFKVLARLLAEALQAAHRLGILHRDIKPANLLIRKQDENWAIRLIDFGLALDQKVMTDLANTLKSGPTMTGTLDYAAPEQLGKILVKEIGKTADVYAFGRTCCYALFGNPNPAPARFADELTPKMRTWLSRCLEVLPDQRYPDFDAVLEDLKKAGPKKQRSVSPEAAAEPPPKKSPEPAPVSPPSPWHLIVLRGRHPQHQYQLHEGANILGRQDDFPVDIDLELQETPDDAWSSRRHAKIEVAGEAVTIQDLNSTNGTFVNRTKLTPGGQYRLVENAIIQIGAIHLRLKR